MQGQLVHEIGDDDELESILNEECVVRKKASQLWIGFRKALLAKNPWLNQGINPLGLINIVRITEDHDFHAHRDGIDGNVTLVFRLKGQSTVEVWCPQQSDTFSTAEQAPRGKQWRKLPSQVPGVGYVIAGSSVWHRGKYKRGDLVVIMRAGLSWTEYKRQESDATVPTTHEAVRAQWSSAPQVDLPTFRTVRDDYAVTEAQGKLPLSKLPWQLAVVLWMWPSSRTCLTCDMVVPEDLAEDVVTGECGAAIWPATMTTTKVASHRELFAQIADSKECVITPEVAGKLDARQPAEVLGINGVQQIGILTGLDALGIDPAAFGRWIKRDHPQLYKYLPGVHLQSFVTKLARQALAHKRQQLLDLERAPPPKLCRQGYLRLRGRGPKGDVVPPRSRQALALQAEIDDIQLGLDQMAKGELWHGLLEHSTAFLLQTDHSGMHMDTGDLPHW